MASIFVGCGSIPTSQMALGHRSLSEIKEMLAMIDQQIGIAHEQAEALKEENREMQEWLKDDSLAGNNVKMLRGKEIMGKNDSLVSSYEKDIAQLRLQKLALLGQLNTDNDYVQVSGKASDVSGAYVEIKNMEKKIQGDTLWGVVENLTNRKKVYVVVTNNHDFTQSFTLDNDQHRKSEDFAIPTYGWYTITFYDLSSGESCSPFVEKVTPSMLYHYDGKVYSLKSALVQ
jgi:hypothetical protein